MADLKTWRNAISQWWNEMTTPIGSFQTRITRTPGQFVTDLPQGTGGLYDKGFIKAQPGVSPEILRHESLHSLFDSPSFRNNSDQIAGMVSSQWKNYLTNNPQYQKEIGVEGLPAILANEGAALDISKGMASEGLVNFISSLLSGPQKNQFGRLVESSKQK